MYRKSTDTTKFKPKKMILSGTVYDVDSQETLNKLRAEIENKKKENLLVIEEQKNQKVLVRRTRSKNNEDTVTKEFKDINDIKAASALKERRIQQLQTKSRLEQNKKADFSMVSKTGIRKPISRQIEIVSVGIQEQPVEEQPKLQSTPKKPLNIVSSRSQVPIKKLHNDDVEKVIGTASSGLTFVQHATHALEEDQQIKVRKNAPSSARPPLAVPDNSNVPDNKPKVLNVVGRSGQKLNQKIDVSPIENNGISNESETGSRCQNELSTETNTNENQQTRLLEGSADISGYFNQTFEVNKAIWYILILRIEGNSPQGLVKVMDENKSQIIPTVKINNDMFLFKKFDNYSEYRVYLLTTKTGKNIDVHAIGLNIKDVKTQQVSIETVTKGIDIWKLRKFYDLEFINYYLGKIKLDCTDKFIMRFKADHELYRNQSYFDTYLKTIKLDKKTVKQKYDSDNAILYLIHSSIEYENCNYTMRTHYLLKNINGIDDKYEMYGISRYGYPYDKDQHYYQSTPTETQDIDNVPYIKLLNKNDNLNQLDILDYIKKYISAVIKMALESNAKLIHACSNYWNGLAGYYAAKYLNIKFVYEVRNLWDDTMTLYRPEIKNSDMVKMVINQEKKVLESAHLIITTGTSAKDKLIEDAIDESKIRVIPHGVDTKLFNPDDKIREKLRSNNDIKDNEIVIGYIGTIASYEGIDYILKCLKTWDNINIKFLLIGDGPYKNEILKYVDNNNLQKNFIYLGKMDHEDAIQYYNVIDIIAYPAKKTELRNKICSYKLLEAMSMEKPIIVPDLESYHECIKDQETGLFFEPENVDDLSTKIISLIENKDLRIKLGENARKWVIENREWSEICQNMIDIYDTLLDSSN